MDQITNKQTNLSGGGRLRTSGAAWCSTVRNCDAKEPKAGGLLGRSTAPAGAAGKTELGCWDIPDADSLGAGLVSSDLLGEAFLLFLLLPCSASTSSTSGSPT